MNRDQVYDDMKKTLGVIPSFFKEVPDRTLDQEWDLFKRVQLDASPIPNKYRELIGLAISATTKCRYCIVYHTELAKLFGATDEEIEDAVHYGKSVVGWSAYINGMSMDYEQFRQEVLQACAHVREMQAQQPQATAA